MKFDPIKKEDIQRLYEKLTEEAESGGYHLNPDLEMTLALVEGLLINQGRYGYQACPCRIASGDKTEDLDIICPCDYRDPDLDEYETCYCGLYVSKNVMEKRKKIYPIPERRPSKEEKTGKKQLSGKQPLSELGYPVYRCRVCGYLCARENPPEVCPICKARKERFERFI